MFHAGFASHFRAGAASYSEGAYNPLFGFLPSRLAKWIPHVVRYWFQRRHEFRDYTALGTENGIYSIEDRVDLSLLGDWGTGTDEAQKVADCTNQFAPDFTIHLGDVYYVGDANEIGENYLGEKTSPYTPVKWPMGRKGSFALSGNHEMYARGMGYYNAILPKMGLREARSEWGTGQWASFFCLENHYWRIMGIDTGYNSTQFDWGKMPLFEKSKWIRTSKHLKPKCELAAPMIDWLRTTINPDADSRGLILLSHHGCHSAFSDWYQTPSIQLSSAIHRPALWFWGHEHKLAIYDRYAVPGGIETYGRCVGHGGMPVERGSEPDIECRLLAWDNRRYENGEPIDVGYNGSANLSFDGPSLHVDYRDLDCRLLFTEDWRVDIHTGALQGPNLKKILDDPAVRLTHLGLQQATAVSSDH
jgi:Calcineurin-like phosphoesterase